MSEKFKKLIKPAAAVLVIAAVLAIAYFSGSDVSVSDSRQEPAQITTTQAAESSSASAASSAPEVTTVVSPQISVPASSVTTASTAGKTAASTHKTTRAPKTTSGTTAAATSPSTAALSQTAASASYAQATTASRRTETVTTTSAPSTTTTTTTKTTTKTTTTTTTATKASVSETVSTAAVTEAPRFSSSCSLKISCATIFDNLDKISAGVLAEQPADGIIFPASEVGFDEGETVFDLLRRICSENDIQIEYTKIAATNNYYIEGINNLYEFDAGTLSGWMYSVNGHFPQLSSSQYKLSAGDTVEFVYSCNIGVDVGDDYFAKAG